MSARPDQRATFVDVADLDVGVPFDFYVVVEIDFADIGDPSQNLANGVRAWDASLQLPSEITLLSATIAPANSIDVGPATHDFIVGVGGFGIIGNETPFAVVLAQGFFLAALPPEGVFLRLDAPLAAQTIPGRASWVELQSVNGCTNRLTGAAIACIRPFAVVDPMLIADPLPTEQRGWGALKSDYREPGR